MLSSNIRDTATRLIGGHLPSMKHDFANAIRRDEEKNASMGRRGGIALYFPGNTAEAEVEKRIEMGWLQIRTTVEAEQVDDAEALAEDVALLLAELRPLMIGDVEQIIDGIARRNGSSGGSVQIDRSWEAGLSRVKAQAEAAVLAARAATRRTQPGAINFSGTVHSSVIQSGAHSSVQVTQTISEQELATVVPLLRELVEAMRQSPDADTMAISVVERATEDVVEKRITADGLAAALTFVLGTWDKLKTIGVLGPVRMWLAGRGYTLPG